MTPGLISALGVRARALVGAKPREGGAICADMARLLPGFREQVEAVLADMRAAGFNPRVFETWRSPERVAVLAARGTGSLHSVHPYGIAADIIDAQLLWSAKMPFWLTLTKVAEARGLTCGSRFSSRHDLPHIQAIPVSAQAAFVELHGLDQNATNMLRDGWAAQFYRLPRMA